MRPVGRLPSVCVNTLLPCGPRAWLVEVERDAVIGLATAVRRGGDPAVVEVVPAARTVLVQVAEAASLGRVGEWLRALRPEPLTDTGDEPAVEIPVTYDGEDLDAVSAACGLSVDDVIARHQAGTYRCGFCGFAPGFAYLTGLDPALHLPRRPTPRTRVPAGSVAIAAEYAAVYPSVSPGGWHLIGRTDAVMWDPDRRSPALVRPGTHVTFETA